MSLRSVDKLGAAVGWLTMPAVCVLLASMTYEVLNRDRDPERWDADEWIFVLGPLWGFAWLAGATVNLPDDPDRRGWRSWIGRRSLWVALGPWVGVVAYFGGWWLLAAVDDLAWFRNRISEPIARWRNGALLPVLVYGFSGVFAYGWLVVVGAVMRRARRRGRLCRSLGNGLLVAVLFMSTLLSGFWATTRLWRSYFFDKTIAPAVLIAALGFTVLGGCASPQTMGDVRRHDLFQAMLLAWVLGLAFAWRWYSRRR